MHVDPPVHNMRCAGLAILNSYTARKFCDAHHFDANVAQVLRCRHPHCMGAADALFAAPLPHELLGGVWQRCKVDAELLRDLVAGPDLVQGGADAANIIVAPHGLQPQAALGGQVPIRAPAGTTVR